MNTKQFVEKSILVFFFFLMWWWPISLTWVKHMNHSPVINAKIPTRVLGLPQSIELIRNQTRDLGKVYWGPYCSRGEWKQIQFPLLTPQGRGWGAGSLHGVRVAMCPGLQLEMWLRCFAYHPPPVVLTAGSMCSPLLLFPTPCFCSQVFRSGSRAFWPFCIFLSIICPNLFAQSYF